MYVQRNTEALSRYFCCHKEATSIAYSECMFIALVVQHAMRVHRNILSTAARPDVPYFSTLSYKRHD
jgi:hypothetical protein